MPDVEGISLDEPIKSMGTQMKQCEHSCPKLRKSNMHLVQATRSSASNMEFHEGILRELLSTYMNQVIVEG